MVTAQGRAETSISAPCLKCDRVTTHRRDDQGALHCVPCVMSESMPPSDAPTPAQSPITPMVDDEPKRWRRSEIAAAVITVAVLLFLGYAFLKIIR